MYTSIRYPGAPLHTNGVEGTLRDCFITCYRKCKEPFPNWKAAHNFSTNKTFTATCKKTEYLLMMQSLKCP